GTVADLGADPTLVEAVQQAVASVDRRGEGLYLSLPVPRPEGPALSTEEVARLPVPEVPSTWEPPHRVPLLADLLRLASDHRRRGDLPLRENLERDVDALHRAVAEQRAGEAQRLCVQKLAAVAELAAGAGHEINNPLAVISGQAQYLLSQETEPGVFAEAARGNRAKALQTIVKQAQRIHQILNELMQFARPSRPHKQLVDVGGVLRDVTAAVADLAKYYQVEIVCSDLAQPLTLHADPGQLRMALLCLL